MSEQRRTALTWLWVLARVAYTTLGNHLVGLTPEENHWRKGEAWSRVGAYRWAAWHLLDSAAQHYREAYARNKHPDEALGLAQLEMELGNVEAATRWFEPSSLIATS